MKVLITGASSGIGRGLAETYLEAGAHVGALARRADLLEEMARNRPTLTPLAADVRDADAMQKAIAGFAAADPPGLDLVIANAGVGQETVEQGWDPARARLIAEINILGTTNTLTHAATIMVEQFAASGRRGRLVGISSLAASLPLPASAAYGASKAWMVFYLRSLAIDLTERGVDCTVVLPGYVRTAFVDGPEVGLLTPHARAAAKRIADGIAQGRSTIRFPARVALQTDLARLLPASLRNRMQRARLRKRSARRAKGPDA